MHSALISRQSVGASKAALRHPQARAPAMPSSYSVVKSFPALPIRQSKAVTIALSVVNHASGLSEAPASVRLLAGSQSSHAPHPAQLRCLIDLGVFLAAFPQRVETEKKGTTMHTIRNIVLQDTQCQWCGDYAVIECTTCDHMECDTCGAGGYCDCIGGQTNE